MQGFVLKTSKGCALKRLENRVAIITGAAGGLGRATSIQFVKEGAEVCLIDINDCESLVAELKALNPSLNPMVLKADVTQEQSVLEAVSQVVEQFKKIDVLVNIAGIVSQGSSSDVSLEEWHRVLNINLTSTFICSKAVLPHMRHQRYGRIISMSSVLSKNGGNPRPWINPEEQARAGNVAYGVSKAGINALTFFFGKRECSPWHHGQCNRPWPYCVQYDHPFPSIPQRPHPSGAHGQS